MQLKPFFCYFGGKWLIAPKYPVPKHEVIVEPFAGAAGYATRYADRRVILVEKNPVVAGLWSYLIRTSPEEIRALPSEIRHTVDEHRICQEAKTLIGFWLNKGAAAPHKKPSSWMRNYKNEKSFWGPEIRERIARQVDYIRHWRIFQGSYDTRQIPNGTATWFVDPPYQGAGIHYKCREVNFETLSVWCRQRNGQVIVCENEGATWLPFQPFVKTKNSPGAQKMGAAKSREAIYVQG